MQKDKSKGTVMLDAAQDYLQRGTICFLRMQHLIIESISCILATDKCMCICENRKHPACFITICPEMERLSEPWGLSPGQ